MTDGRTDGRTERRVFQTHAGDRTERMHRVIERSYMKQGGKLVVEFSIHDLLVIAVNRSGSNPCRRQNKEDASSD